MDTLKAAGISTRGAVIGGGISIKTTVITAERVRLFFFSLTEV